MSCSFVSLANEFCTQKLKEYKNDIFSAAEEICEKTILPKEFCLEIDSKTIEEYIEQGVDYCISKLEESIKNEIPILSENIKASQRMKKAGKVSTYSCPLIKNNEKCIKNGVSLPRSLDPIISANGRAGLQSLGGKGLLREKIKLPQKSPGQNENDCLSCAGDLLQKSYRADFTEEVSAGHQVSESTIMGISDQLQEGIKDFIFNKFSLLLEDQYLSEVNSLCNLGDFKKELEKIMPLKMKKHKSYLKKLMNKRTVTISTCENGKKITLKDFRAIKGGREKTYSKVFLKLIKGVSLLINESLNKKDSPFNRDVIEKLTGKNASLMSTFFAISQLDSEQKKAIFDSMDLDNETKEIFNQKLESPKKLNLFLTNTLSEAPLSRYFLSSGLQEMISVFSSGNEEEQEKILYNVSGKNLKKEMKKSCHDFKEILNKINIMKKTPALSLKNGEIIVSKELKEITPYSKELLTMAIEDYLFSDDKKKSKSSRDLYELAFLNCKFGVPYDKGAKFSYPYGGNFTDELFEGGVSLGKIIDKGMSENRYHDFASSYCEYPQVYNRLKRSYQSVYKQQMKEKRNRFAKNNQSQKENDYYKKTVRKNPAFMPQNDYKSYTTVNTKKENKIGREKEVVTSNFRQLIKDKKTIKKEEEKNSSNDWGKDILEKLKKLKEDNKEFRRAMSQVEKNKKEKASLSENGPVKSYKKVGSRDQLSKTNTLPTNQGIYTGNNSRLMNKPTGLIQNIAEGRVEQLKASGRQAALFDRVGRNIDMMKKNKTISLKLKVNSFEDLLKKLDDKNEVVDEVKKALIKEAIRGGLAIKVNDNLIIDPVENPLQYESLKKKINELSQNDPVKNNKIDPDRVFYLELIRSADEISKN